MDRVRVHEGIRRMRFTDVLGRSERSELSQMEAAELLGILRRCSIGYHPALRGTAKEDGLGPVVNSNQPCSRSTLPS